VTLKSTVFTDVKPCGSVDDYRLFGGMSPPLEIREESKQVCRKYWCSTRCLLLASCPVELFFNPEDGDNIFLRNICKLR
jgi:hypothetical protein